MHPRTAQLLKHLDEKRAILRAALDDAPPALRDRRPAPHRWSLAEVLEHLAIVEQYVGALLQRGLRRALAAGALPRDRDHTTAVAMVDARGLLVLERRLLARDWGGVLRGLTAEQAWAELEASRAVLREVVLAADGLATRSIKVPHPFLAELTLRQWIAFVGFHEGRHAAQINATIAALADDAEAC